MTHLPSIIKNFNSLPEIDLKNGTKSIAVLKDSDILEAYVNHRKHLYFTFKTYMEPISFNLKVSPYIFVIVFIVFLKGRTVDTLRHPKKTE